MMDSKEFWIETGAFVTAVLIIPIYMGVIHVAPPAAAAYAGVGGVAMAAGEELQFRRSVLDVTLHDVLMWVAAIGGLGGIAYALALIFI